MTTTTNALILPGGSGDYVSVSALARHWRTNNVTEWLFLCAAYLDDLAPGENGTVVESRRTADGSVSSGLRFNDTSNRWEPTYNASAIGSIATSPVATTWQGLALRNSGASLNNTLASFSMAGALVDSMTSSATTSAFSDGQQQSVVLGARFNGTSSSIELRGRIYCPVFIWRPSGAPALPDNTAIAAFFADPLNVLAEWIATYGANLESFESSLAGSGGGSLTLNGTATLGTANGPTVPDLVVPTTAPTISTVGAKSLAIIYDTELGVPVAGAEFGTDPALVELTADPLGSSGLVAQTVRSSGDTSLTFDCALGGLTPGPLYLKVTNQTIGDPSYGQSDLQIITVNANSGAGAVAVRRSVPSASYTTSVAISTVDVAGEFFVRNAQEAALTITQPAGTLPTGLSVSGSTLQGTVDSGAAAGSPYSSTIRATDSNGDYVELPLQINVAASTVTPTTKQVGSWGRRGRA